MKPPRIPLATKVLLGLVLNLAIVGIAFTSVLVVQIRLNPGWLLAGRTGDRLRAIADMMAGDLSRVAPGQEAEVVERYHEAYDLDFLLLDGAGRSLAKGTNTVPQSVQQEVLRPRLENPQRNPGSQRRNAVNPGQPGLSPETAGADTPNAQAPRRNRSSPTRDLRPDDAPPASDENPSLRPRSGPPRSGPRAGPVRPTVIRAGDPAAYWILMPLPPPRPGPSPGLVLVLRAPSLWSGGFLLDLKPWVLAGAGALVLSILFWLPIVRGITRDIHRLASRTGDIAAGRFEARPVLARNDELGLLADAVDQMAARLGEHAAGQRRFLGDAAHELTSPLARMQAILAILETRPASDHPAYLKDLGEELDAMAALVNELLAFSRALHGRPVRFESVELRPLVDRAWTREGREGVSLVNEVPAGLRANADPQLLQRAVANLVRNAVRYASHAGPITAQARIHEGSAELAILDVGPGVSPEALPRLFEPFFRPEDSRSRESGGVGLGLAIVRTCLEACQGTVTATNRQPRGFEVRLRLPPGVPPGA